MCAPVLYPLVPKGMPLSCSVLTAVVEDPGLLKVDFATSVYLAAFEIGARSLFFRRLSTVVHSVVLTACIVLFTWHVQSTMRCASCIPDDNSTYLRRATARSLSRYALVPRAPISDARSHQLAQGLPTHRVTSLEAFWRLLALCLQNSSAK
jgi:hypothetical protein